MIARPGDAITHFVSMNESQVLARIMTTHFGSFKPYPSVSSRHDNDMSRHIWDFVDRIIGLRWEALFNGKDSRCDDTHCDIVVVLSMREQIQ